MQDSSGQCVILGAGPSGLGVAWGLSQMGINRITVVEKEARVGGLAGSFRLGDSVIDYGPHRFSPEFPELIQTFSTLLGSDFLRVENQQAVFFKDHLYPYPPRIRSLFHPSSVRFSVRAASSYLKERARVRRKDSSGADFPSTIRHAYGTAFSSDIIFPICKKVWGEPETLDPYFAHLRFITPSLRRLIDRKGRAPADRRDRVFYYPREGFQQMWDALAETLVKRGIRIELRTKPLRAEVTEDRVTQITVQKKDSTEVIPCRWLVSTIPALELVALLGSRFSSLHNLRFPTRQMLLCTFLIRRTRCLPARVVIFPEKKFHFSRLSEMNQFSACTTPRGLSAVSADVLADADVSLSPAPESSVLQQVRDEMLSLGWFFQGDIEDARLIRVPDAYPVPSKERESNQRLVGTHLQVFKNLLCTGRFASSDYNNAHTAFQKGYRAGIFLASQRPIQEWRHEAEELRRIPIRD